MGDPLDATGMWARALRALWEAAGRPTGAAIIRQAAAQNPPVKVTTSSWSDWYNGKNVPSKAGTAQWLVGFLRGRAYRKTPGFVTEPDDWWDRVWKRAQVERQRRGGRPPKPYPLHSEEVGEQVRVGVMPRPADCFQDREVASRLEQAAEADGAVTLRQAAARSAAHLLAGTGGVGKTQLAAAYARRAWERGVEVLVWVNTATRDGVISAYADAALRLNLPLADPDDPEQAAREFLTWAETTGRRWLVVLDDVQAQGDLRGWWPPTSAAGRTLVTTRRRDLAPPGLRPTMVEIGLFTPGEADAYLCAKLGALAADDQERTALIDDLGRLPLALAQAAAYMVQQDLECGRYRRLLAERLLADAVPEPDDLLDDQHQIVSAVWEISVARAGQARPAGLARPLLQLTSVLDPNGIPAGLLTSQPAREYLATYLPPQQTTVEPDIVDQALRLLHRYSLIDHDRTAAHREIRVHQLVQRATREDKILTEDEGSYTALIETAADALLANWPESEGDHLCQVLRANTIVLREAAETTPLVFASDGLHPLLFHAITSLGEIGQVHAAISAYADLASSSSQHLGADHPHTLAAHNNLAAWRGEAGDAAGAAEAYEQHLYDFEQVLGPDHPETLATRGNLARWRGAAGNAARAIADYEQLLPDVERVLDPDHLYTLTTRQHLAQWRGEEGDVVGALAEHEQLLPDFERVLGPHHPHTLTIRQNLARWRGLAGDTAGAVADYEQLLTDRMRLLKPDHPDILTARGELAFVRAEARKPADAIAAYELLLPDFERVLGPDHPETLSIRANLAFLRGEMGDAAGAAADYESLLTDQLRVLGPDHHKTLTTRVNLASWRGEAGDVTVTVAAFEELLPDLVRVLGPDHWGTLAARANLAYWRGLK
ncbi:tetratricopeptide repeat protein [Spirillospora sp. CA-108201]